MRLIGQRSRQIGRLGLRIVERPLVRGKQVEGIGPANGASRQH